MSERGDVTVLLDELRNGHSEAEARLLQLVYVRLKQIARRYLGKERPDHTLQATDLVHEAYLRFAGAEANCQDRSHFFGVAAQAMRRILVDHARAHAAGKRAGGARKIPLDEALLLSVSNPDRFLEINDALDKLAVIDARQARIVEMRFFAGLTHEEAATALHLSDRTVKRELRFARAWLHRELTGQELE